MNPETETAPQTMPVSNAVILREGQWQSHIQAIRLSIARNLGLLSPSIETTPVELKAMAPLPGDTIHYIRYASNPYGPNRHERRRLMKLFPLAFLSGRRNGKTNMSKALLEHFARPN